MTVKRINLENRTCFLWANARYDNNHHRKKNKRKHCRKYSRFYCNKQKKKANESAIYTIMVEGNRFLLMHTLDIAFDPQS